MKISEYYHNQKQIKDDEESRKRSKLYDYSIKFLRESGISGYISIPGPTIKYEVLPMLNRKVLLISGDVYGEDGPTQYRYYLWATNDDPCKVLRLEDLTLIKCKIELGD